MKEEFGLRRPKMSVALVGAFVLFVGLLSGCANARGQADSRFITVLAGEPQNPLIPSNTNEINGGWIVDRLFAGLESLDADGNVHDDAAESVDLSGDRLVYTIKIRPGQTFTNGEPVTAHSYVDAWNYGAYVKNKQLQSSAYEPIVGYEDVSGKEPKATTLSGLKVQDDLDFTVTLSRPNVDFKDMLAWSPFYPLPQAAFKDMAAYGERPIGNGPYEFASPDAWQHNVRIDLKRSPGYHGPRQPKNTGLSLVFYESLEAGYADLVGGNLDYHHELPENVLGIYKRDLGDRYLQQPIASNIQFTIPYYLPHFSGDEGRLRRLALAKAINREQICKIIFDGTRTPMHDFTSPVIPGYDAHIPGSEALDYNPDEAKKLWAQADAISKWSGTLYIGYNFDGGHQTIVDATANYLRRNLGIAAEGKSYAGFKEIRDLATKKQVPGIYRNGWFGDYPTALDFLQYQYATDGSSNDSGYSNPEFDALLRQAAAAATEDEAAGYIRQAQQILFQDMPVLPMLDYDSVAGYSARLDHPRGTWNGAPDFENLKLKDTASTRRDGA